MQIWLLTVPKATNHCTACLQFDWFRFTNRFSNLEEINPVKLKTQWYFPLSECFLDNAFVMPFKNGPRIVRLHVGDLQAVGSGEGPWAYVTPRESHLGGSVCGGKNILKLKFRNWGFQLSVSSHFLQNLVLKRFHLSDSRTLSHSFWNRRSLLQKLAAVVDVIKLFLLWGNLENLDFP